MVPSLVLALLCAGLAPGCSSLSETLCDLECECEGCSDSRHELRCEQLEWMRDISEIYDCESEWESWGECLQTEGTCDASRPAFTTEVTESCTDEVDSGLSCLESSDCIVVGPSYYCAQQSCRTLTCGSSRGPCVDDSDCPSGVDLCGGEREALAGCVGAATDSAYGALLFDIGFPSS